uniref:GNAT family N-acetyltransferase n=1 Tax=Actinomadura sp. CA-154981 TaxID=3240037 RepID=UPI003F4992A1
MNIRKALPDDREAILRISNGVATRETDWATRTLSGLESIDERLHHVFLVAVEDEEVVAYVWGMWVTHPCSLPQVSPDENLHVIQFAVADAYREKEHGTGLVRVFAEWAREFGPKDPFTVGFNVPKNSPLQAVLVELGCEITPTGTFYNDGVPRLHGVLHLR